MSVRNYSNTDLTPGTRQQPRPESQDHGNHPSCSCAPGTECACACVCPNGFTISQELCKQLRKTEVQVIQMSRELDTARRENKIGLAKYHGFRERLDKLYDALMLVYRSQCDAAAEAELRRGSDQ